jgi:agarase
MAVSVANQRERGIGFRSYTEQIAAMPYFVGCHFFQYVDEPITGRFDSETAFNGFVNVADIPSPYLVEAAQAANRRIYQLHSGAAEPVSGEPRQ